jgi:hypothetical protein
MGNSHVKSMTLSGTAVRRVQVPRAYVVFGLRQTSMFHDFLRQSSAYPCLRVMTSGLFWRPSDRSVTLLSSGNEDAKAARRHVKLETYAQIAMVVPYPSSFNLSRPFLFCTSAQGLAVVTAGKRRRVPLGQGGLSRPGSREVIRVTPFWNKSFAFRLAFAVACRGT